jgi:hypothetical protein
MNYNFSVANGVYEPLTTKTVFQSGTQLNTDAISSEITLPFPFTMYGVAQTKVFLSNNGFITFGSAPSKATIFDPISSTSIPSSAVVSGLGNQIIASAIGNPEISFGQNSNNDMVFQFTDVAFLTAPLVRFTFQMILKANGTTVNIMFGANCTGQAIASTRGSQIGLRGAQTPRVGATPFTEFKNCNNLSLGNGNWNVYSPNGVRLGQNTGSSDTTRLAEGLNMIMPNSGLTYQWIAN